MPIGDDIQRPEKPRARGWNWLLWWRIDPTDLDEQVRLYDTIGFRSSMRGISVMMLAFSAVVTALAVSVHAAGMSAFVDVALFVILAVFIYFGHRWAMIGAMALWTLEKLFAAFTAPLGAIFALLWWAFYMHAFYFAFRIERQRRSLARHDQETLRAFE